MDLTKILAVSGKPGLFKMLSQTKSGFIVESLTDGKRFPIFAHERISSLEEISIFSTGDEDIPLKDIFKKIYDKTEGNTAPDPRTEPEKLAEFFKEAVPEHDSDRVYASDIKKTLSWYNLLLEKGLMTFEEEEEEEKEKEAETPGEESTKNTKEGE